MNNIHTFSIIFYKDSSFIHQCIKSLLNQSVKSNIIICTSTPTTKIKNIADKYGIELYINPNPGKANDWNFAYKKAKTQFVTLTHHDDDYHQNYLKNLLNAFELNSDALIGFTNYDESFVDKNRNELIKSNTLNLLIKRLIINSVFLNRKYIKSKFSKKALLSFGDVISCPTVTFNKNKLNNFKFEKNLPINLDWEAWWKLANTKGGFVYIKTIELTHRIHIDSHTTQAITGNERLKEDIIMFNRIWHPVIAKILIVLYKISYKGNNA